MPLQQPRGPRLPLSQRLRRRFHVTYPRFSVGPKQPRPPPLPLLLPLLLARPRSLTRAPPRRRLSARRPRFPIPTFRRARSLSPCLRDRYRHRHRHRHRHRLSAPALMCSLTRQLFFRLLLQRLLQLLLLLMLLLQSPRRAARPSVRSVFWSSRMTMPTPTPVLTWTQTRMRVVACCGYPLRLRPPRLWLRRRS
jgi:hypothetical protein